MMGKPLARGAWVDLNNGDALDQKLAIARLTRSRVVCLGETHDRADIHRWQLHVSAGLLAAHGNIALGFEMFPRRVQSVLDRWVDGELSVEGFLEGSEWDQVWRFDPALYLPLFHFCRAFQVPMLALNCERPLVTRIGKEGWDAVPEAERDGLTPARPATSAYRRYLFEITGGHTRQSPVRGPDDPSFDRFVRAQQVWDRAFACNMLPVLRQATPPLLIGIIGRGHLEHGHGTPYQLADLGIDDVAVALPHDRTQPMPLVPTSLGDLACVI